MLGNDRDRRAGRHAEMRAEIVAVSWRLAEEHGVAGLSLREVARELGMRAPSLYTYVASKDELYDLMFAEGYTSLGETASGWIADEVMSPEEALARVLSEWIRFCQASVARYQLMFTKAVPGWEPSAWAYEASQSQYAAMVAALEPFGVDSPEALDLFTAVSSGLAAQQLANDPEGDRWVRRAPDAARMLLAHLEWRNA